jgi:hypothetical protein
MQLAKIYFTFKILKNAYLAHFLMFNFNEERKGDNFFSINEKLVNQRYIDELIKIRHLQEGSVLQLDL